MAIWNITLAAGWRTIFYEPRHGFAHRLHAMCPACQQVGELDLRTPDRRMPCCWQNLIAIRNSPGC
jgi:hypothetical protein